MVGQTSGSRAGIVSTPVVKQDTTGVTVVELRLLLTIHSGNLHRAFADTCRHREGQVTDVELVNVNLGTINGQCERRVGIIHEVVAIDGSLLASLSPFVAHVVDRRTRNQHLEVVRRGVVRVVDHEDLVEYLIGNLSRNSHNHRVVGDQTGNQFGFLVVEEQLGDTAEVVTNDTDIIVHISTCEE